MTASKPGRAWWQWVLSIVLFGSAAAIAVYSYVPGLRTTGRGWKVPPREIRIDGQLEPADAVPVERGALRDHNVLIVTFDTTRADRIGCYGHDGITTPAIDRIAREGVLFSKAVTPAPTTLPSHGSIMTGLYPFHHGARANMNFRLGDERVTLAEVLKEAGYTTGAAVSAFVLDEQFGLDQGFDWYEDKVGESTDDHVHVPERRGDETNELARQWLRDHADRKFFLWVHYYDPHFPYRAPVPFSDQYRLPYDAEIAFTDAQLGQLLGLLDELQLTDRTLVVVAGDHGEGLGQHDEHYHASLIYESTMHVPMVMSCGDKLGGGLHVDRPVSLVDVMPTILAMLGLEGPEGMDGVDLTRPFEADRPIFVETLQGLADYGLAALLGVRSGDDKLIFGPDLELYDLETDPYERNDLLTTRPQVARALEERLRTFYGDDLEQAMSAQATHDMSAEDLAKLQALGYLGGGGELPPPSERMHPRKAMPILARMNNALQLEETRGLDATIEALESIIADHPTFAVLHRKLGDAYIRQNDLERAEQAYEDYLALRPADAEPLMALADVNLRQRRVDEAVVLLEQVLSSNPDHFRALNRLARVQLNRGEIERAAELQVRALAQRPNDEILPDQVVDSMGVALGRSDEVIEILEGQLESRPNLPMVRNALARVLTNKGDHAGAIAVLKEGIELAPDRHELTNNLAFILIDAPDRTVRRPFEAAVMMEHVCEDTGYADPRYLHTLSRVYASMTRLEEAISVAEKARQIAAESDDPLYQNLPVTIGMSLQSYRQLQAEGMKASSVMNPPAATDTSATEEGGDEQPGVN